MIDTLNKTYGLPTLKGDQRQEFIGDALLTFLLRDILCTDWTQLHFQRGKILKYCNNRNLSIIARHMGIEPFGKNNPLKDHADAMEAKLYQIYKSNGLDAARQFVEEHIIGNEHLLET